MTFRDPLAMVATAGVGSLFGVVACGREGTRVGWGSASASARFEVPLAWHGSAFAVHVWNALREIPVGQTRSDTEVADAIGAPSAVRAVARANGGNALALRVPCHRASGSDGSPTGHGGGLWRKRWLIDLDRRIAGKETT